MSNWVGGPGSAEHLAGVDQDARAVASSEPSGARERVPVVQVRHNADGSVRVVLDGNLVVAGPIDRAGLGGVLSALADELGPLRVELTDATGRVFVDLLRPPARPAPPSQAARPPATDVDAAEHDGWLEVTAGGFVPGEDVEVAAIVTTSSARGNGIARGLIDLSALRDGARGVVLFGAISGTVAVRYRR